LDFWRERKSFLFLRTTTTLLLLNTWTALFLSTLFIRGGLNLVFIPGGWEALNVVSSLRNLLTNFNHFIIYFPFFQIISYWKALMLSIFSAHVSFLSRTQTCLSEEEKT